MSSGNVNQPATRNRYALAVVAVFVIAAMAVSLHGAGAESNENANHNENENTNSATLNVNTNKNENENRNVNKNKNTNKNENANENENENENDNENHNGNVNRNGRLEAVKLRVCQNRQAAIQRIMARMADRTERQIEVFTKIATRVEQFYAEKGKTISNYDALVADVQAKQAAAQTQVAALKAGTTFDCNGSDPKGFAGTFKNQLKATISAMKDYKTSVRNLIVGVRSAQGETNANVNATNSNENHNENENTNS